MDRDIVSEQMDCRDPGGVSPVEVGQEGQVFYLALATGGHAIDPANAGVEGGEQGGGAAPGVFVLDLERMPRPSRAGGDAARARLQGSHFVETEHNFVWGEG